MTRMLIHYEIPDVQIGVAKMRIYALRCNDCKADFHTDKTPRYCPQCGTAVSCTLPMSVGKLEVSQ